MPSFRFNQKLMGSIFEFVIVTKDKEEAHHFLEMAVNEIVRIENVLSEFIETSDTWRINQASDKETVSITPETHALIKRCSQISSLTNGCFDISVRGLKQLYRFKNSEFELPEGDKIKKALMTTGYKHLQLKENSTIEKKVPGLEISFAAVGKGYAADRVKEIWQRHGLHNAVISASGDLCIIGQNENGQDWKVGITDPDHPEEMLFYVPIKAGAVATSGDYMQYLTYKGKKYSHNINPITGSPCESIKSVSVFSPSAELSDALATALYVMGPEAGIDFVKQLPDTHAIIIDLNNQIHFSKNIRLIHEEN